MAKKAAAFVTIVLWAGGGGSGGGGVGVGKHESGPLLCWASPASSVPLSTTTASNNSSHTGLSKASAVSGQISFRTKTRHGIRGAHGAGLNHGNDWRSL